MKLEIITPQGTVFAGEVDSVLLPGKFSAFEVLKDHAPIISSLGKGKIVYKTDGNETALQVNDGFVEVVKNHISVCVESTTPC